MAAHRVGASEQRRSRLLGLPAVLAAAGLLAAGCQGPVAVDKAGAETAVLRLATIDKINNNGQSYGPAAFVQQIEEISDGRLQVEVSTTYGDRAPDAESRLVRAIASGELDGGWPSTRAFAKAGIPGLEAVEAPMAISSYAAQKVLVARPAADAVLAPLAGSGVAGLGLAVGPLRRPFAAGSPLLSTSDWAGARFRVYNSPAQSKAVRALGGEPVELGLRWVEEARAGTLRGAEFDLAQYDSNGLTTEAGHVTSNVVLWPKVFVLAISQDRFDALDDQQQGWLRAAAEQATQTSLTATYDESTPARAVCERGVRFSEATPAQLQELRGTLQPVIDGLRADPVSRPVLELVESISAEHGEVEPLDVPVECRRQIG